MVLQYVDDLGSSEYQLILWSIMPMCDNPNCKYRSRCKCENCECSSHIKGEEGLCKCCKDILIAGIIEED